MIDTRGIGKKTGTSQKQQAKRRRDTFGVLLLEGFRLLHPLLPFLIRKAGAMMDKTQRRV